LKILSFLQRNTPPQTTPLEAQISEAAQERDWAAHSLAKAVASGDTRSIHAGRDRMKRATHELMKLELQKCRYGKHPASYF